MKRALVTGGAGFIGSHVSQRLLEAGWAVTVIDDLNEFYSSALKNANLREIGAVGRVQFHQCNICDDDGVSRIIAADPPELIVHLAARAGVRPSLENPLLYEQVNVRGTMVLLEACRKFNIPKFVFASSSSIYGISNHVPFREDDPLQLPISPYAATKIAGEKICYTYSHLYGLNVVCLRFFTVYGPRQRPDLAIRKFTEMIDRGDPIPVFGDGSSGRDYTYIDDIVSGIMGAIDLDAPFDVFNLGNAHPVDLRTLIETIENALGKKAVVRRLPLQPGDVPITFADISKAKKALGYCPATPFHEGIQKFIDWYVRQPQSMRAQIGA